MENGGRYWDGNSWDSDSPQDGGGANPCNVGSLAGGTPCGLNAAAVGVAARAGLTGTNFTLAESGFGFEAWGNGDGSADLNYGFDATGGGALRLPDARRVHRRLGRQRNRLVQAGQPAEPPHHLRRDAAVGATAQVYIPTNFGFYYTKHLGQRRDVFYTQSQFNRRATSSSSPPSSAGITPSSASRTSSRTC